MDGAFAAEARRSPGSLLRRTLRKMKTYLGDQIGDMGKQELPPVVTSYLTAVLLPARGQSMSLRNSGELRALASAIDLLCQGKVARAADLLAQRFKSVEMADGEGHWRGAKHVDLIPEARVTCMEPREREAVAALERAELKLKKDLSTPGPGDGKPNSKGT